MMLATSTIPLSTATPNKAIKPTPADILKGIPRRYKANTPPIADKGIAVKISAAYRTELKVRNSNYLGMVVFMYLNTLEMLVIYGV